MQTDVSSSGTPSETVAQRRTSLLLVFVASAALAASCLLISPGAFSEQQKTGKSLLSVVIGAMALTTPSAQRGAFPTPHDVEIGNLFFYVGAALLLVIGGVHLVTSKLRPRLTEDELFELRDRAAGPHFWWGLMLLVSVVTSVFAHAPDVCEGQVIIRFIQFAWWWPLAALVLARHVRSLSSLLLGVVAATAAVGVWHYSARVEPQWFANLFRGELPRMRLRFPIGNEGWFGACLLPVVFVGLGLLFGLLRGKRPSAQQSEAEPNVSAPTPRGRTWRILGLAVALVIILIALGLTRSRSAGVGLAAGVVGLAFLGFARRWRPAIILLALLIAIGGAWYIQHLRVSGVMGQRAHSIRSRLNYEWPYALALFFQKPVGGHGEGCYAMLAGQQARADQLDDPAVMAVEQYWTVHAHNEWLELLADVGLAGAVSFLLAIVVTLVVAVRFCDRARGDPSHVAARWLAMGLTAALIAMVFEEGSSPALREPGFPPIFFTVWAVLWALVRSARPVAEPAPDAVPLSPAIPRVVGVVAVIAAVVLGYFGIQDWRAARARFVAAADIEAGQFDAAIREADFAGSNTLAPFRRLTAQNLAVEARARLFAKTLASSEEPPSDAVMQMAQDAMSKLDKLNLAAPSFLGASQLAWQISWNQATAYHRRGQEDDAREHYVNYLHYLELARRDEPFRIDLVERLWRDKPQATAVERFWWLRCLIRRGEMDGRFLTLVQGFGRVPGARGVLDDLTGVAMQDHARPARQWNDRLSPETLRLAALARDWAGQSAGAVRFVRLADEMYTKAGGRLFQGHAAALHELVRYELHDDPTADADERLSDLARAQTILVSPTPPTAALPDGLGLTRLRVLLAAGRQSEAETQLRLLHPDDNAPMPRQFARAYVDLAEVFAYLKRHTKSALSWAKRAVELDPDLPDAYFLQVRLFLQEADDRGALGAAQRFIEVSLQKEDAFSLLQQAEVRWPSSGIWADLRRRYPDYPAPPARDAPPLTTTGKADEDAGDR